MQPQKERQEKSYWQIKDMVTIGIFAAVTGVLSLLVYIIGGEGNLLTTVLQNLVFTAITVIVLYKIGKFGALTLFIIICTIVPLLLESEDPFLLPPMIVASVTAEAVIVLLGGYRKRLHLVIGVGLYDLLYKGSLLALSWFFMHKQQELLFMATVMTVIGSLGSLIGLFIGALFCPETQPAVTTKERHTAKKDSQKFHPKTSTERCSHSREKVTGSLKTS